MTFSLERLLTLTLAGLDFFLTSTSDAEVRPLGFARTVTASA